MRKHSAPEVFRITGARAGLTDDVRARQRRYVISMSVRTLCFILAATLWQVQRPLAWIALVLGGVLPYIAVVIANAGRENAPSLPSSFNVPPDRRGLGPGPEATTDVPAEPLPEPAPEHERGPHSGVD